MNFFKRLLPNYKQHLNDKQRTKGGFAENNNFEDFPRIASCQNQTVTDDASCQIIKP
jgi:hypothetical protein